MAYARAVKQFFDWCEERGLGLNHIEPMTVAAYVEQLGSGTAKPTVKQHLAAIRQLFDYLVTGGIMPANPATSVRGPKFVVKCGKTPVLSAEDARKLLDSIDVTDLIGLRDRALIGVMVFSFARVGAAAMRIEDYFQLGKRWWLRLHEKGGKRHEVPSHHNLEAYLDAWINAAGIAGDKKVYCCRSIRKGGALTENPMTRTDVLRMIKRRAEAAAGACGSSAGISSRARRAPCRRPRQRNAVPGLRRAHSCRPALAARTCEIAAGPGAPWCRFPSRGPA
jgi:integrase/recombinase XerD